MKNKAPLSQLILESLAKLSKPSAPRQRSHYYPVRSVWVYGGLSLMYTLSYGYRTARSLEKKGLVKVQKIGPKVEIQITPHGLSFLEKLKSIKKEIPKPEKWNGLWQLVIFDIPEKEREVRDLLRDKLKFLGFKQVQKSVWVFPYPCRQLVLDLCRECKALKYVSLFEGRYLGNDRLLRRLFEL